MLSRVHGEVDDHGSVTRMTGTIQDVTSQSELSREMARVNEELQQVNQLNADVLGVVGHDVRQPLALVLGQLEVLGTFWDDSDEASKLDRVDKALAAAKRLSALIDDILAMVNFDTGTIATRPISVRLEDVVTDALAGVHDGAAVEVRVEGDPVAVVDPFHLRQMVANLVSNALRYGALPVVVTVARHEGAVFLEVLDHGPGVPQDFVPHLFERFTRASSAATGHRPGAVSGSTSSADLPRRTTPGSRTRRGLLRARGSVWIFLLLPIDLQPAHRRLREHAVHQHRQGDRERYGRPQPAQVLEVRLPCGVREVEQRPDAAHPEERRHEALLGCPSRVPCARTASG